MLYTNVRIINVFVEIILSWSYISPVEMMVWGNLFSF